MWRMAAGDGDFDCIRHPAWVEDMELYRELSTDERRCWCLFKNELMGQDYQKPVQHKFDELNITEIGYERVDGSNFWDETRGHHVAV